MKKVCTALACLLVLASTQAKAWSPFALFRGDGAAAAMALYCPASLSANAQLTLCNFGTGGGSGGGGAVTESGAWNVGLIFGGNPVSPTNLLGVSDGALDALIAGGKLPVSVVFPTSQAVTLAALPALPAGANAIGSVSVSNLPATQAVTLAALPALPAGANAIGSVTIGAALPVGSNSIGAVVATCLANTSLPSASAGSITSAACDLQGRLYANVFSLPSLAAGANAIGSVTVTALPALPTGVNTIGFVSAATAATGGASQFSAINAAASAMAATAKASGGTLYGYEVCNNTSALIYFRLFQLAGAPVVGTSSPIVRKLVPIGTCQSSFSELGIAYTPGISFDVTTGSLADADTATIATASQVSVSIYYK